MERVSRWSCAVNSTRSRSSSKLLGDGCVEFSDALLKLLYRHVCRGMLDLHLLGQQLRGQAQPNVRLAGQRLCIAAKADDGADTSGCTPSRLGVKKHRRSGAISAVGRRMRIFVIAITATMPGSG